MFVGAIGVPDGGSIREFSSHDTKKTVLANTKEARIRF
jgi:hypothetical protein